MKPSAEFSADWLQIDAAAETERIVAHLQESVVNKLHHRGAVVGISGGIDSSVCLALCVRAFGPERVVGILLPEKESSPRSAALAHQLAGHYGVTTVTEDITGALEGAGCYERRNEAILRLFPEFGPDWQARIVMPGSLLDEDTLNFFQIVVTPPAGPEIRRRLPVPEYAQIVASSNFKQRMRMSMLYYHAELRNYAVIGTANKDEHALGFFVKYGDGGSDVAAIAHLFKTQVYQLAEYLDVPLAIRDRQPTTDTYGAGSQEEFFFRLPFEILDPVWMGMECGVEAEEIADALELTPTQVERITADLRRKLRNTQPLRTPPILVQG